jgi:hypothetical protein
MPDGIELAGDLLRPNSVDPLPTLLHRTPYNKREQLTGGSLDANRIATSGFNLFVQDVRGRFASGGIFNPYVSEQSDGHQTLAWIMRQPWSKPAVGMLGRSYAGAAQWLAASGSPPPSGLLAIAPEVGGADFYEGWTYRGGVLQFGYVLHWLLEDLIWPTHDSRMKSNSQEIENLLNCPSELYNRPWQILNLVDQLAPYYKDWLNHTQQDEYWRRVSAFDGISEMTAPSLSIGGWYDVFLPSTLAAFKRVRSTTRSRFARESSRLIVGPWNHTQRNGVFSTRTFDLDNRAKPFNLTDIHIDWFRSHLCNHSTIPCGPPVELYIMGVDKWRNFEDWPPPQAKILELFLHSAGGANTVLGDGTLCMEVPDQARTDLYIYNPNDPAPTVDRFFEQGKVDVEILYGPTNKRHLENRSDMLFYTSAPLNSPMTVVGEILVVLYASFSAPSTDFTAKLFDVFLDGTPHLLCDGIIRAGHRGPAESVSHECHGEVSRFVIEVGATANVFRSGHRIRLAISSSNFPRFDRNPNTGGPSLALGESKPVTSRNRVHHGGKRPSCLLLPVLPGTE